MKVCKRCKSNKVDSDFYSRDSTCKDCRKALVMEYRAANIDRIRAYDRSRGMLPHRVDARSLYQKTDAGKAAVLRGHQADRMRYPEKYAARNALNNAVRDGVIVKPSCCSICGSSGRIHGHHDDYSKPLDVMWLCAPCHRQRHKQLLMPARLSA